MIAALLVAQTATLSHAAEHGEEHHEHDGVECQIVVIAAEDNVILPNPPHFGFDFLYAFSADVTKVCKQSWQWPPERGPPPRSPPFDLQ